MPTDNQLGKRKRELRDTTPPEQDYDEDGEERPYNENEEPFPAHPAFDERIKTLKTSATANMGRLLQSLAENVSASPSLLHMQKKAESALIMPDPDRLLIALVGDTGVGNSVLNTVTDDPKLARVIAGGESCTTVPTIYCDRLPWQTDKPYAAGIRYLCLDDCTKLMEEQIDNYNLWHFQTDKTWTDEQNSEYSQSADTAVQTFRTLFCNEPEFNSEDSTGSSLESNWKNSDGRLLRKMSHWCKRHIRSADDGTSDDSYKFFECSTTEELGDYVDKLTLPSEDYEEPALWPTVERVDIGAQRSRLLKWVTIADLAGLTDTNKIRVKSTHKHIQKCEAMWYVVSVDRVVTDPNLERTISTYAERFPSTLAIIVTKIDGGLDEALAKKMRNSKENVHEYFSLNQTLKTFEKTLKELRSKTKRMKTGPSSDYVSHQEKMDSLQADCDKIVFQRNEVLARARNDFVTRRLKQDKQKHFAIGAELPILCVSNSQYLAHKGVEEAGAKIMSVQATGIPALRTYALQLAAPNIWETTKTYLSFNVAGFVHGANAWAEADHKHRRAGLMQCVKNLQKRWNFAIDPVPQKLLDVLDQGLISKVRSDEKKSLDGAMEAFYELCDWNPGSFRAFFRKEGKHSTRLIGRGCWNQMFIQRQTDDTLEPAWYDVMPQLQQLVREAVAGVAEALKNLPGELEQQPGSVPIRGGAFHDMLQPHVLGIEYALNRRNKVYETTLGNIKLNATRDHPTAYFTLAMTSVYERYKSSNGDGVTDLLKNALRQHLSLEGPKSPFAIALDGLSRALDTNVTNYVTGLRSDIQGILDGITQQLQEILDGGVETPRETMARKKLLNVLQGTLPEIKRIEQDLKMIDSEQ